MELKQYLEVIFKRRWVVIQALVVIVLTVLVSTYMQKPVYEAGIKILIHQIGSNAGILSELAKIGELGGVSRTSDPLDTQIELIRSRPMIEEVIRRLGLKDQKGEPLPYKDIISRMSISPIRMTDIIQIKIESTDPAEAMNIANTLGQVYVEESQKLNQEEARKAKEFIENQALKTGVELSDAESTLDKQINIAKLTRSARVAEQIYIDLLRKLAEARISEAMRISNVRIIESAALPKSPIKPKKAANAMLALLFGSVVGLGFAFLFEYMDDTIQSVDELGNLLKLPVLGAIPKVEGKGNGRGLEFKELRGRIKKLGQRFNIGIFKNVKDSASQTEQTKELIVLEEPRSPAAESYRTVRTNIQFIKPDEPARTVCITSAGPSEGKTVFVSNLAAVMAQTGKRVLLVDSDLRKPRIHKVFGLPNVKGLTSYLAGAIEVSQIIQGTKIENLRVITSGPIPPNPAELIESKKMLSFINDQKKEFDIILFDSPPVMSATDAALLGSRTDGLLFIVDSSSAVKQAVLRAKQLLLSANAKILGVVLQKVSRESGGYYYNYYKYYHYQEHDDAGKNAGEKDRIT
jgi:capsular exopolysaccharide synthesis family protein